MQNFNLIRKMYRQLDAMVADLRECLNIVETTDDLVLRDMLVTDMGSLYLKVEAVGTRIEELSVTVPELPFYPRWADEAVNAAAEMTSQAEAFQRMQDYLNSLAA